MSPAGSSLSAGLRLCRFFCRCINFQSLACINLHPLVTLLRQLHLDLSEFRLHRRFTDDVLEFTHRIPDNFARDGRLFHAPGLGNQNNLTIGDGVLD